jgi:hypothetical protein
MAIRISFEIDEDRLRATEMGTTGAEIRAAIEALADGSRLSLQSRQHWMLVRNPRIRAVRPGQRAQSRDACRAPIPVACAHDFCHSVSLVTLRLCHLVTCCYSAIAFCGCLLGYAALILVLSPLACTPMH